jgi:GNAT superfamily N-acetyltransferase
MSITIKKVRDKALLKKFVYFNINLYKGCEQYVPPLIYDEFATLNKEKNPAFDHCEAEYFLAYKNGEIVGRIAAIINHKANEIWKQKYARFSFVDFIDDAEVANKLFGTAESWASHKGMTHIHGPMGFTDLDHQGLLIDGYDRISTMLTSYSYPYYKTHIERMGYVKDQDWNEYLIPIPKQIPERFDRVGKVVQKRFGLIVKHFEDKKEVSKYARDVFVLLNKAYKDLYGYVELSDKQIDYYVNMYIPMLRLEFFTVILRQEDHKLVGFGIGLPSLALALQKAKGKFMPAGWFHLYRALKGDNNKVLDLLLIGVDPEYQGKGVNALIFNEFIPAANRLGFEVAESNPELALNNRVQSMWDGMGAEQHKKRRAYIKEL